MGGFSVRCKLRRNNNDTGRTDTSSADSAADWDWDIWISVTGDMEKSKMTKRDMQNLGMGSAFVVFWLATAASIITFGLELMK